MPGTIKPIPLPSPLAAAVSELETWMQDQLLADQARSTPTAPLYHYTREGSLRGILENGRIWCFSHNQQSDPTEVIYSLDIAQKVIKEEADRNDGHAKSMLLGLSDMLANNPMEKTFDFYFFSMSGHRDHPRQWAEYADSGKGFALGLAPKLLQPDRDTPAKVPTDNLFVGKVIYGRDATLSRHRRGVRRLADIVSRVARANGFLLHGSDRQAWLDEMNHAFIATLLIWNCLTAKSSGYHSENETRYIAMGVNATFDGYRRVHGGRNYIETPLVLREPGNLVEIQIGKEAPGDAEEMVEELLRVNGYPPGIAVVRSFVEPTGP